MEKPIYLDNADNALQNYLDNENYRDKIMTGYYTYILDSCNSKIALCTNVFQWRSQPFLDGRAAVHACNYIIR